MKPQLRPVHARDDRIKPAPCFFARCHTNVEKYNVVTAIVTMACRHAHAACIEVHSHCYPRPSHHELAEGCGTALSAAPVHQPQTMQISAPKNPPVVFKTIMIDSPGGRVLAYEPSPSAAKVCTGKPDGHDTVGGNPRFHLHFEAELPSGRRCIR